MTVICGIESEELSRRKSDIKLAILNNEKLEDKLNVIMVLSNPCEYKRRWFLAKQFIAHMEDTRDVELYVVELAYGNQKHKITDSNNKNHLQLRCDIPLWHKENMFSIAVKKLLPSDWKSVAWVDADLEFENVNWASDTLKILNGCKDVVQVFSHCIDMNREETAMNIFSGFGFQYEMGVKLGSTGVNFFHPGYGFAFNRKAYDKIGGVFQYGILGSGDHHMAQAFIGNPNSVNANASEGYKNMLKEYTRRCKNIRLGYTPGVIRHFFHGSKKNRKYIERWQVLVKHQYDPYKHVTFNEDGILVPSEECPSQLPNDILQYFTERQEDD